MATNNFKAFGTAASANVTSQADYEALAALLTGFQSGKASSAQINKALRQSSTMSAVIGQFIANSGSDALDNGDVTGLVTKLINALITNLRLGAGAPAIGIPFYWPSAALPNTVMAEWADMVFLKWNGATFSAVTYPKLAQVIPGLVLTESRGEFIRVWDDARGVDASRALLSAQSDAIRNITGKFVGYDYGFDSASAWGGAFVYGSKGSNTAASGGTGGEVLTNFDASLVVPTANENRPRNIAFNFLVRAK